MVMAERKNGYRHRCKGGGEEERKYISGMIDGIIGCSSKAVTQTTDRWMEKMRFQSCIFVPIETQKCISLHKEALCLYLH